MLDFPRWKIITVSIILIYGVLAALPSLMPESAKQNWPSFLPHETINLGLDLSGGSHILLEAAREDVAKQQLENMEEFVRGAVSDAKIEIGEVSNSDNRISFMVRDTSKVDAVREALLPLTTGAGLTGQRTWNINVQDTSRFVITPTEAGLDEAVDQAVSAATEVVRKRIDELGTREPTIIRQGATRIVVQVPGLDDPDALKELLGKTAELEFKLVDLSADPAEVAQGRAPFGSEVFPYAEGANGASGGAPFLAVKRLGGIKGDRLTNAQQSFDQQNNVPVVNITFDREGGAKFAQLTEDNVGKPFAIILDGEVLWPPILTSQFAVVPHKFRAALP